LRRIIAGGAARVFPALLGMHLDALAAARRGLGHDPRSAGGFVTFRDGDPLRYVVFGPRGASPTDRPEHFQHRNGAESLVGVWLAADDFSEERKVFARLGAAITKAELRVPERAKAEVVRFGDGEIVLLPENMQWIPDRRIVGVTLRTRDLAAIRAVIRDERIAGVKEAGGASLIVPPDEACGLRLEFRSGRAA
jgi:hypothetical protein